MTSKNGSRRPWREAEGSDAGLIDLGRRWLGTIDQAARMAGTPARFVEDRLLHEACGVADEIDALEAASATGRAVKALVALHELEVEIAPPDGFSWLRHARAGLAQMIRDAAR